MALIALIAAAEAMLFSASRSKRGQTRRQQVLMGNSLDSVRALPLVDDYLKRKTAGASTLMMPEPKEPPVRNENFDLTEGFGEGLSYERTSELFPEQFVMPSQALAPPSSS